MTTQVRVIDLHGKLSYDPKESIERKISLFGKKIQVQHLITIGTIAAVTVGSLLLGENNNEDAKRSY